MQTYILQQFYQTHLFEILENEQIEWLGNEVSCGVGMQRIDILACIASNPRKVIPIELKSTECYSGILSQIKRYIDWIEQYYIPNRPSDIQPMIICRQTNKHCQSYQDFMLEMQKFNENNAILPIVYVEFRVENNDLVFERII